MANHKIAALLCGNKLKYINLLSVCLKYNISVQNVLTVAYLIYECYQTLYKQYTFKWELWVQV